jgi:hypothetical protein
MQRCGTRVTQPHATFFAQVKPPNLLYGRVGVRENFTCFAEKQFACSIELNSLAYAAEKTNAKLLFQCLDLLAQRRLLYGQLGCSACDVLFLSNGDKIPQMAKFHILCFVEPGCVGWMMLLRD